MIESICQIAQQAGRKILEIYRKGDWDLKEKPDASPVTAADFAANEIILTGLKKVTADLLISEEASNQIIRPETLPQRYWLIDPLDGTKNFVARQDSFCVNIALLENGQPILGVIHAPVSGQTFWAEKGRGAFCDGQPIANLSLRNQKKRELIAVASGSEPSPKQLAFIEAAGIAAVQRFGSAIKMCRVAEGSADLYPRFGPTSEWDVAAGHVILNEAGCKLVDLNTGLEMTYGKPGFLNNGFVACRSDLDFLGVINGLKKDAK